MPDAHEYPATMRPDSKHVPEEIKAKMGRNILAGPTSSPLHEATAAEVTRKTMTTLAATWRRDNEDSLDTFGQHLMGGAVLSCAEQLEAALATLPDPGQSVRILRAETLRHAADLRYLPGTVKGPVGSAQRAAVEAYAQFMLDEADRLAQPATTEEIR